MLFKSPKAEFIIEFFFLDLSDITLSNTIFKIITQIKYLNQLQLSYELIVILNYDSNPFLSALY